MITWHKLRDRIAHFEFRPGTMDDIALTEGGFANASATKRNFYCTSEIVQEFLLCWDHDFLCSLYYFLQKNLTDAWAQL